MHGRCRPLPSLLASVSRVRATYFPGSRTIAQSGKHSEVKRISAFLPSFRLSHLRSASPFSLVVLAMQTPLSVVEVEGLELERHRHTLRCVFLTLRLHYTRRIRTTSRRVISVAEYIVVEAGKCLFVRMTTSFSAAVVEIRFQIQGQFFRFRCGTIKNNKCERRFHVSMRRRRHL